MKRILFLVFFIFISLSFFAQVKVEKSRDIAVVLGRKYYVHVVKKGETLYSLEKVYNVPRSEILLVNKEEVSDLKEGSILRIPVIDEDYKPTPVKKIEFKEHTVSKNESLYSIAYQYGMSQDEIIKYNPQIQNGLQKGMVLKIPVITEQPIKAEDEFFVYYKMKNGDKIDVIAKNYGVTVNEIKQFNENLNISEGQIIAIPKKHLSEQQIYMLKNNSNFNPNFIDVDLNYFEDPSYPPCSDFIYSKDMKFEIAILLPLFIDENYSLSLSALSSPKNAHNYLNSFIIFNYLQGTILAIDKLKKEGLNLNIHIYDTRADSATVEKIFSKPEMRKMDLIFGPVYSKFYGIVEKFTKQYKINVVSPLSKNTEAIQKNPFVFQIEPSLNTITKFTSTYFSKNIDTSLIVFIYNDEKEQLPLSDSLLKNLKQLTLNPENIKYKNIFLSKFITTYKDNLSSSLTNIVYLPSTDEIQVSAVLNNLNALVNVYKYKIIVYTQPAIQNFSKLQTEWLSNLNVHYVASSNDNYENPDTKEFIQKYKTTFGLLPDKFSYVGFDATYYFIDALRQYGKYFQFCLGNNDEIMDSGLFMKFYFKRVAPLGGFENQRLIMMYYTKDLQLIKED